MKKKYKIVFDRHENKEFMTIDANWYIASGYVLIKDSLIHPIIYSPQVRDV